MILIYVELVVFFFQIFIAIKSLYLLFVASIKFSIKQIFSYYILSG